MNPKNVLFVTYYWPPAGGAAVNRTLKFQKYLHQYGWNPIILTVKDGDYPSEDPSLLHEVDSGTHVFTSKNVSLFAPIRPFLRKGGYLKPRAFANSTDQSLKTRILRFFKFNIIPDTRIGWRLTAVKKGMELIQSQNIDLIYSTSPPQTNHIIASVLSRRSGIPWVGDFRDPWSDQFWLKEQKIRLPIADDFDRKLERKTLNRMTQIVSNSPGLKEILQKKTDVPISVIFNGFDEELFRTDHSASDSPAEVSPSPKSEFTMLFAGSVSYQHRPAGLIEALNVLKKEKHPLLDVLKVQFMGSLPTFVEEMFEKAGLAKNLEFLPFRPMNEAIQAMQQTDILLLLGVENSTMGVIPSKLFEYLRCYRPVLAYGLEKDAREILEESGAGYHADFYDLDGNSAEFIKKVYEGRFQVSDNQESIQKYDRKVLTGQLAALFNQVVESKVASVPKNNVKSI